MKEIADALKRAEAAGLAVEEIHRGHRWGMVRCGPCKAHIAVYGTPRDPAIHAEQIDRFIRRHVHPPPTGAVVPLSRDRGGKHAGA
jgi:hypothetical protein